MKKLPQISIVVPIYNVEEYIAECLQSLMRQTYAGPMECILVDGTGTDRSMTIAKELVDKYKGPVEFRIIRDEYNRGLSGSRNNGIDHAKGDYIYFLDSDDYISDDCIEKLVAPLQEREYDVVVGDFQEFGGTRVNFYNREERAITSHEEIVSEICTQTVYVMAWNKLVSRHLIEKNNIQFIERALHEDVPWHFEVGACAKSIYVVNHITYYYRIRSNSLAAISAKKQKSDREFKSYVQGMSKILQCANIRNIKGEDFDAFVNHFMSKTIAVGFDNDIDIQEGYKQIRALYKMPRGVRLLLKDPQLFKKRLHWYLPIGMACRFLKWKYIRNKR